MPAPLNIAARRAMVEELQRQEPGISARTIAARLGVGKDTVRRDIAELETEQRQRAAATAPPTAETEPQAPPPQPDSDTILIPLDDQLRQDLAVLRATRGGPDTPEHNARVVRALIRATADNFRQHLSQEGTTP